MKRAPLGFTLLETSIVIAIIAILATLALAGYMLSLAKAEAAATLSQTDHIRKVVAIETRAFSIDGLADGSIAGKAPSPLAGRLVDDEFLGPHGLTLQLLSVPAGTFASNPEGPAYALMARTDGVRGRLHLVLLRDMLPQAEPDKLWTSENGLLFSLEPGTANSGGGTVDPDPDPGPDPEPPPGGTRWTDTSTGIAPDGTWTAQARICIGGSDGKPLVLTNAHVQIREVTEAVDADGATSVRERTRQTKLDASGCATFSVSGLASGKAVAATFEVVGIVYFNPSDPPVRWDGTAPVVRLPAPGR